MKTKIIAILAVVATASAQLTYVNPGSSPDATDGDTIRNAFITCNNNFAYIGGQLSTLNNSLSGLGTTYDPAGLAILVGLNATNYVRYAMGTNTVGWLGCLNAESNVLQGDVTALTNNINSLWTTLGGSSILHSGGQMLFDQDPNWPHEMQIISDGGGNLTVDGSIHASYLSDSYRSTPAVGMVATSQGTDGTWQWVAPPAFPTTMNFDSDNITSDGSGNITAVGFYGRLLDTYDASGSTGCYARADGDGTWSWTEWPSTLNCDSGSVVSDGSGDVTAVSVQAQLWDSTTSAGGGGQIATAQGDGTWLWQTPAAAMVAGPAAVQNSFTNAAGARFALVVNAQTNGFIFVPQ